MAEEDKRTGLKHTSGAAGWPQDGRIIVNSREQVHAMRVNFLPLCLGESVTARVLSGRAPSLDLDGIGYTVGCANLLATSSLPESDRFGTRHGQTGMALT